ncbi:MAG: GerAB/ArcD/ProY family transporter [Bacillota bacterium]
MLEDGKISNRQAVLLIVSTILPSIMFMPGSIYREAAQDGWMSVILATVFAVAAGAVIAGLGIRFPDRTIEVGLPLVLLAAARLRGKGEDGR